MLGGQSKFLLSILCIMGHRPIVMGVLLAMLAVLWFCLSE